MSIIKKIIKSLYRAGKSEVEEIKELKVTEEDLLQAEKYSLIVVSALTSAGFAFSPLLQPVLKIALGYCIRDIKDGETQPDKLLIKRIFSELEAEFS